jgi:hypothetical protein
LALTLGGGGSRSVADAEGRGRQEPDVPDASFARRCEGFLYGQNAKAPRLPGGRLERFTGDE